MSTIRAFIALEIDQLNKQKISEVISKLKKSDAHIKWVTENQMHLTLKFLGNIEEVNVQKISDVLKSIADNFKAFMIQFSKIGAFPTIKRPRVIWIAIEKGSESLKLLANKIETELEKLGFEKEDRDYKAHLTLGRVKSLKNLPELTNLINQSALELSDDITIDKILLFQSTSTPKGAIYTRLTEHALG